MLGPGRRARGRWTGGLILAAMIATGCANLNYASSLAPSSALDPNKAYLYGRFSLAAGSKANPILAMELSNLDTGEILSFAFRRGGEEHYFVAVTPGEYQFTHFSRVPGIGTGVATAHDVRRNRIQFPWDAQQQGMPFRVKAGKAYYIGDYVGTLSLEVDNYFFYVRVKTAWGLSRISLDYEGTTAEMKRLRPLLDSIETAPAWALP